MSTRRSKTEFRLRLRRFGTEPGPRFSPRAIKIIRLGFLSERPPKYFTQYERHMKHLERVHQCWKATGDIMRYERERPKAFRRLAGEYE